ncbi:Fe(3+)-hydroxamate ABC transporter permease FhuB [Chitinibacter tainanensis]|uniref:Fe(3+)-hydroxamate ABC transporter permease FhuB n=1 Tax=Chitinibacter tainanensis TaxID=230667 RepID=UPI00040D1A69|nr:Fe(3+)-hydroxamate ABC transporter permease FhuB [Chitinibacter tainanensis]
MKRPAWSLLALVTTQLAALHIQIGTPLSLAQQWQALHEVQSLEQLIFVHTHLPRTALAVILGMVMALAGGLLQLLTQNPLASPMTLGTSAGAWCAIVLAGVLAPTLQLPLEWLALGGSLFALTLVGALAGWRQLHSLNALLAGTALNLLLGSVAAIAVMLNDQYSRTLLVWGTGDLAQNDWAWVLWLLPRLAPALLLIPLLCKPLHLLQLGSQAAAAAGLNVMRLAIITSLLALWLNGLAIAAVGIIGFVSLLAPALARLLGAHKPADNLGMAALLGAITLLLADIVAIWLSHHLADLLPTSAAIGLLGGPILIWLCLKLPLASSLPDATGHPFRRQPTALIGWCLLAALILLLSAISGKDAAGHWLISWPDAGLWALRWPRMMAACAAGMGLAIAGLILQRLLNNPLASPDLLGISAGASLGMLIGLGIGTSLSPWLFSSSGAVVVLLALCWLAPRQSPARLILLGIGLSSLLEAALQLVLAQGNQDSFQLLNWLAGSTYHTTPTQAIALLGTVLILGGISLVFARVLLLFGLGETLAQAVGLAVPQARVLLLLLAGLLSLAISSQFGPLAFIGLVLPQLAIQLGARTIKDQLWLASLIGAALLGLADLASRTVFFPSQIPVGALASLTCGSLLVIGLLGRRRRLA